MPLFSVSFGDELEAQGESVEISFDHFVKFGLQLLSAAKRFQEMHLIHCDRKLLNLLDLIKHQYVNRLKEVMYLLITGLLATKDVRFYYGAYFQRIPPHVSGHRSKISKTKGGNRIGYKIYSLNMCEQ